MADMLLKVQHVSKHFGGFNALTDVSLQVRQGERFGLIGPERLGQNHPHQLYLRGAAQRWRQNFFSRYGYY